jgi:hypothetical protein
LPDNGESNLKQVWACFHRKATEILDDPGALAFISVDGESYSEGFDRGGVVPLGEAYLAKQPVSIRLLDRTRVFSGCFDCGLLGLLSLPLTLGDSGQ